MSKNTTTTTTDNTTLESNMDSFPRPTRRLGSTGRRAALDAMDAKIASFEQLGGISRRTRSILDQTDAAVDAEWRSERVNRLALAAASASRGGL